MALLFDILQKARKEGLMSIEKDVEDPHSSALFQKYPGAVPPFAERVKVYRAAGYPAEYIAKVIERHKKLAETAAERQKALDEIFAKWPSASKAVPKPKPKGKVIKAVKKRT